MGVESGSHTGGAALVEACDASSAGACWGVAGCENEEGAPAGCGGGAGVGMPGAEDVATGGARSGTVAVTGALATGGIARGDESARVVSGVVSSRE